MKLSIIIPNFNYAQFIEQAVRSIFEGLARSEFEIIIVDDASTDQSWNVISALKTTFPCVRAFKHSQRQGVIKTCADGFRHAVGEYVHFFASDDIYLPQGLDKMLHYINCYPEIALFSSQNAFFYSLNAIQIEPLLALKEFHYISQKQVYQLFRNTKFWIPGHTVCFKRCLFQKEGGTWDPHLESACDWYFNHKMALTHGLGYIPHSVVAQRKHDLALSQQTSLEKKKKMWLRLLELFDAQDAPSAFYRSGIMRMLGIRSIFWVLMRKPKYWRHLYTMSRREINLIVHAFRNLAGSKCQISN